jgi:predicted amidohydrolase YtcJ
VNLDVVLSADRILTLDPSRPIARRIGVLHGRIVGFDEDLDGLAAHDHLDLPDAVAVPGLHDAHHHLSARGRELRRCDVSPTAAPTLDALYATIGRFAEDLPGDAWVECVNLDHSKLDGVPDRDALDAASGGRPVFILHASHHSGIVSTGAIRRLGYADPRDLRDVDNGWVERAADGSPTGMLAERALQLVYDAVRPEPFEVMVEAIRLGAQVALAEGLTSITEPGIGGMLTGNGPVDLAAFQAARDRGHLGVRTTVMPELAALHDLPGGHPDDGPDPLGLDLGLRSGLGDDTLRIGGVKVFADGALTARTAALREPYLDRPDTCGFLLDDREVLHERIVAAHRAGWQVATHAIGDAAVDVALDAYEDAQRRYPREGTRHRIEHCGITHDDQIPRIAALGVIPVPQGRFLSELGDAYLPGLGDERAELLYRQRAFLDAGIEVPGSSDCPVVSGAPLAGIAALVQRTIPGGRTLGQAERLTAHEALRAFTYGSAYADLQEHRKGSLTVGKLADLTVLSDDPTQVDHDRIADLEVVATVVGGEVRYRRTAP